MAKTDGTENTKMKDGFIIKSYAHEVFDYIMTESKEEFDKSTLEALEKKMFDPVITRETNVRMIIPVRNKQKVLKQFKFQIGSGETTMMINMLEFDKYPGFVNIDEPPRIFNTIKAELIKELDDKIKDELDEHISGINTKLEGKTDVRFLIFVPLKDGKYKECFYKKGSGDFSMVIRLGQKRLIDHLRDIGKHVLSHKIYLCLMLPLVLLVAGYNATDVIKVIRVFDPLVSNKVYEVLILLLNKTDDAPQ